MIKFFILIFLLMGPSQLRADEAGGDQEFVKELGSVKNPFEDGLPKPVVIPLKPVYQPPPPAPKFIPPPMPKSVIPAVPVVLPSLKLEGVMLGDDMHEAIINDQIVPLNGYIHGAKVVSMSDQGVGVLYKGKKFFLKVD